MEVYVCHPGAPTVTKEAETEESSEAGQPAKLACAAVNNHNQKTLLKQGGRRGLPSEADFYIYTMAHVHLHTHASDIHMAVPHTSTYIHTYAKQNQEN